MTPRGWGGEQNHFRHHGFDVQWWPSKLIAARQAILLGHATTNGTVDINERLSRGRPADDLTTVAKRNVNVMGNTNYSRKDIQSIA